MSIITPITRLALLGGAGMLAYTAFGSLPFGKAEAPVEQGFANPAHVQLYTPENDSGNRELYLKYSNGSRTVTLPITVGEESILVGDAEHYWNNIGGETRAALGERGWEYLSAEAKSRLAVDSWESITDEAKTRLAVEGWSFLEAITKSALVQKSWPELEVETRKGILLSEFEKMIEKYEVAE